MSILSVISSHKVRNVQHACVLASNAGKARETGISTMLNHVASEMLELNAMSVVGTTAFGSLIKKSRFVVNEEDNTAYFETRPVAEWQKLGSSFGTAAITRALDKFLDFAILNESSPYHPKDPAPLPGDIPSGGDEDIRALLLENRAELAKFKHVLDKLNSRPGDLNADRGFGQAFAAGSVPSNLGSASGSNLTFELDKSLIPPVYGGTVLEAGPNGFSTSVVKRCTRHVWLLQNTKVMQSLECPLKLKNLQDYTNLVAQLCEDYPRNDIHDWDALNRLNLKMGFTACFDIPILMSSFLLTRKSAANKQTYPAANKFKYNRNQGGNQSNQVGNQAGRNPPNASSNRSQNSTYCLYFQRAVGCTKEGCTYPHKCKGCHSTAHGQSGCTRRNAA